MLTSRLLTQLLIYTQRRGVRTPFTSYTATVRSGQLLYHRTERTFEGDTPIQRPVIGIGRVLERFLRRPFKQAAHREARGWELQKRETELIYLLHVSRMVVNVELEADVEADTAKSPGTGNPLPNFDSARNSHTFGISSDLNEPDGCALHGV